MLAHCFRPSVINDPALRLPARLLLAPLHLEGGFRPLERSVQQIAHIPQERCALVLGRDRGTLDWPTDGEVWIVPPQGPVAGGHVRLGALVEDVGVPQRAEAVSESRRNPELSRALARQLDAHPPGEVRRAPAEVHGHVQYPTAQDLDQLPLRSAGRLGRRDQDDIPADTPFEAGYSLPEARRPAWAHIVGPAVRTADPHGSPLTPEFGPSKWVLKRLCYRCVGLTR